MSSFLSHGFTELRRKLDRFRLRRTLRQHDTERLAALTALGQRAWDDKVDLGAHAGLRDRLAGLDARAGELSNEAGRLEKEKADLEARRKAELESHAARRKVVETAKSPVDVALREARSRKSACEQAVKQSESRIAAIAGQQKTATVETEGAKLAAEQATLQTTLAASRAQLPGFAAEEARLAAESQKHAAEVAVIEAEQKAAVGLIDAQLTRVRTELQGTTQQTGAVGKEKSATFLDLGKAIYDSNAKTPTLAEPTERVAAIDRNRAQSDSAHSASLAESSTIPGGAMAKFWGVVLGVPLVLAVLGTVGYRYMHREVPGAYTQQPAAAVAQQVNPGECPVQAPPDQGKGVMVRSNCLRQEGTFARGELTSGKITYPDGRVAEGTFVGGRQLGVGMLTWKDGRRYEGMFVEGRSWGPGVFTAADGTRFDGDFEPGVKLVGIGIRKNPDGSMLVGEFVGGKPTATMVLVKGDQVEVVETAKPGEPAKKTGTVEVVQ